MNGWDKLSSLPAAALREIQNRRLRDFIERRLYPYSPHYRRLFDQAGLKPRHIRTVEDLRHIPFTNKEDFQPTAQHPHRFRDFILQPDEEKLRQYAPASLRLRMLWDWALGGKQRVRERLEREYRPIFLTATTGTTNRPVSFLYTHHDMLNLSQSGYRLMEVFGGKGNVRAVNMFPYAPHLAFWQTVFAGFEHNNFVLSTGGGKVLGTAANIDAIMNVRPNIVIGVPSYVYHVVRTAKEMGKELPFIRKVILGSSAVPLGLKEKLTALLKDLGARNVRVFGTYGFTEAKCAWGECPTPLHVSSGYHTFPDREIFEIINPETGEVRGEGEDGELVFSHLDARGSCVLRYRTGDLVKGGLTYAPCPYCRRTVPRLSSDISRVYNIKNLQLSKIKGTLVNLNHFEKILEAERGVDEWLVEIRKKGDDPFEVDELVLTLSVVRGVDGQRLKEHLKDKILAATETTPNAIHIIAQKEMLERLGMENSHKIKRIVDARPKP